MKERVAKDLLHMAAWFELAEGIVAGGGQEAYLADRIMCEASDGILMKLGEAAGRLRRSGVDVPEGVELRIAVAMRNALIHGYDVIDRDAVWETLKVNLPQWQRLLAPRIVEARRVLG
ncbi:HepT-like ribonuclease domain-containing protein [Luteococcus sp. H138]|uniref:HepT-like ribonuclease domain-containing protein n=1 Tax=unclassified Luteococcus TaxID=2639923 RepID=UPI00313B69FF